MRLFLSSRHFSSGGPPLTLHLLSCQFHFFNKGAKTSKCERSSSICQCQILFTTMHDCPIPYAYLAIVLTVLTNIYISFCCILCSSMILSSCWSTRGHIGWSTVISEPSWHLPQVRCQGLFRSQVPCTPRLHCTIAYRVRACMLTGIGSTQL